MARRLASWVGMAWRLASLGLGPALALLVDPVGFPPLRVGLRRASAA
jgi:hypothetical protein